MTVLDLAHFTDVHLGPLPQARLGELMGKRALGFLSWHHRRHRLHTRSVLDRLVDDLLADPPDHVAITGDLVNIALPGEFELAARWLESIGPAEWLSLVPGNHDAYAGRHLQRSWTRWHAWMRGDEQGSAGRFPFVRRLHDRLALIGLSSAVPSPVGQATGTLGPAQLEALDTILDELGQAGVCRIILLHHPPLGSMIRRRRALRDEAGLRTVIARRGAELVLSGHEHFFLFGGMPGKDAPVPVFVGPSASLAHGPLRTGGYLRHAIDLSGNAPRFIVQLRHCDPGTSAVTVGRTARVECTGNGLELAPADWPKGPGSATESVPTRSH